MSPRKAPVDGSQYGSVSGHRRPRIGDDAAVRERRLRDDRRVTRLGRRRRPGQRGVRRIRAEGDRVSPRGVSQGVRRRHLYATATASPALTPSPRRSATDLPASVAVSTRQRRPSTVTVNAVGGGAAPASVSSNVSVSVASLAVADVNRGGATSTVHAAARLSARSRWLSRRRKAFRWALLECVRKYAARRCAVPRWNVASARWAERFWAVVQAAASCASAGSAGAEPSVSAATAEAVKTQIERSRSDPSMRGL